MIAEIILVLIVMILWAAVMFNQRLKKQVRQRDRELGFIRPQFNWEMGDCSCGTLRLKWKPVAMNRPDNTILLVCPECQNLWEELMTVSGNKWRQVDPEYAGAQYSYKEEVGGATIDT